MKQCSTPILLLLFNRPQYLDKQLAILSQAAPTQLFVSIDGPRHDQDRAKIKQIREQLQSCIDWDCDLHIQQSRKNRGCRLGVQRGIDWFFEQVEQGIILEDDCMPSPSFFPFCSQLLDHYRDDPRVMSIAGSNLLHSVQTAESYFFSKFPFCWGWATWRRAWNLYDRDLHDWPQLRDSRWLETIFEAPAAIRYWSAIFSKTHDWKIDTWDYQWTYTLWKQSALAIVPNVNLVQNVGFASDATHTKIAPLQLINAKALQMVFPLDHPRYIRSVLPVDGRIQRMIFDLSFSLKVRNYAPELIRQQLIETMQKLHRSVQLPKVMS